MPSKNDSTAATLAEQLLRLAPMLEASGVPYALIGGAAVMTYGLRAHTRDLDFLVAAPGRDVDVLDVVAATAAASGWRVERKGSWHLRLWSERFFCDVVAGQTELERSAIVSARPRRLAGRAVRTINVEHLCALKLLAGRPRDRRDVATIFEEWGDLDVDAVNELLRPFGVVWRPGPSPADTQLHPLL